jgi:hypothetical protein
MDDKLQDRLYKNYPKIFEQRKLPMTQTAMCWGVETGNGWFPIINLLCSNLQWDTDRNGYPQVVATQVKEKFGTLRFYYTHAPSDNLITYTDRQYGHQDGMISFVEQLSAYVCEECGSNDKVTQTKGWIVSLCPKCMEVYKKKRNIA